MARWIAFDDETAEAVVGRFKRGAAEIHPGDPLDSALRQNKASLLIMPSSVPGKVLVARIKPKTEHGVVPAKPETVEFEPSGFLGLSDQPVFARPVPDPAPAKKKWWQRESA